MDLLFLFLIFIAGLTIICLGLGIITSPVLFLLYFDRDLGLSRLRYRLSARDGKMKRIIHPSTPFYSVLDEKQKMEYRWRVNYFMESTDFVFKFSTDQASIKLLIALKAVQLSMFLSARSFTMIHRIVIYEDLYFSHINQRYHKGEVNPGAGTMALSWNSVLDGLSETADGLNVLVHELAHALWFEHLLKGDEYTIFDGDAFDEFEEIALREMEEMNASESHLFRKYGGTNKHEFFAVAVENFFERHDTFRTSMPAVHSSLSKLLNHNLVRTTVRQIPNVVKNQKR